MSIFFCLFAFYTTPVFGATGRNITQTQNRQPLLVILLEYSNRAFCTIYAEDTMAFWSERFFGEMGITVNTYFREVSGPFDFQFVPPAFTVPCGYSNTNPTPHVSSVRLQDGIAKVRLNRGHPNRNTVSDSSVAIRRDGNRAVRAVLPYLDMPGITDGKIFNEDLHIYFVVAGYSPRNVPTWFAPTLQPQVHAFASVREWVDSNGRARNYSLLNGSLRSSAVNAELFARGIPLGIGTIVHELMHLLGLPDLYSYTGGFGIGPFSLMSYGSMGAHGPGAIRGSMPTHLDAWSKYMLGFVKPVVITYGEDWRGYVESIAGNYNVLKIINPNVCPYQFFLVENRQQYGFDRGLSRWWGMHGGIVIYHVDQRVFEYRGHSYWVNDNNYHQAVSVVRYYGTLMTVFYSPFFVEGDVFGPDTSPNSNFHDNCPGKPQTDHVDCHPKTLRSGVEIRVNSPSGHRMEVEVRWITRNAENIHRRRADCRKRFNAQSATEEVNVFAFSYS